MVENAAIQEAVGAAALGAAVGVLTFEQAAAMLPVGAGKNALALRRLVARGSIKAIDNPSLPQAGITVEAMKDFLINGAANRALRTTAGAPEETVLPIFDSEGRDWFAFCWLGYLVGFVREALVAQVRLQMPPSYEEMQAALRYGNTKWGSAATAQGNTFVPAAATNQMQEFLRLPIDTSFMTQAKGIRQAGHLRNMGEVYLVYRMQTLAYAETLRREQEKWSKAGADYGSDVTYRGFTAFYASPAVYAEIVQAVVAAMTDTYGEIVVDMNLPGLGEVYPQARKFGMYVSDAEIVRMSGTDYPRLAGLAF
jgi:hypothetical protein